MKLIAVIAASVVLVAIAFMLLAWKVLFVPGSKFPMHHHHHLK